MKQARAAASSKLPALPTLLSPLFRGTWHARPMYSEMAKRIQLHQASCSISQQYHVMGNTGMGAVLHSWTQALCNAMERKHTLRIRPPLIDQFPFWVWDCSKSCTYNERMAPTSCYFGQTPGAPPCGVVHADATRASAELDQCPSIMKDAESTSQFRAAAIEYLFQDLSEQWIDKAKNVVMERQIRLGMRSEELPSDIITVHIRWGDKKLEMALVDAQLYVDAVNVIVTEHEMVAPHIFVTTEDQRALDAFAKRAPRDWQIFTYQPAIMKEEVSLNHGMGGYAAKHGGELGGHSFVALLLAMEARHYVLTTGSNWSRLIDELRTNVLDVECDGCTSMIDLQPCQNLYRRDGKETRWC